MFGIFTFVGTLFVDKDKISAILLPERSFYGVTLIDDFDLPFDVLEFIDKVELSSMDCGERTVVFNAV